MTDDKEPQRIEPQYVAGSVSGQWVLDWQNRADELERELAEAYRENVRLRSDLTKAIVNHTEDLAVPSSLAAPSEDANDAARYRWLKDAMTVPKAMQSFLKHNNFHPDTFALGVDEAIDAAMDVSHAGRKP